MSKSILDIKKGAIVTRVASSKPYPSGVTYRSYMGDKLKFIGVANSQIYFQSLEKHMINTFGADKVFGVPLDIWELGWDYYIDPTSLLDSLEDRATLEIKLQRALDAEDYILAEKLKKQLEK